MATEEFDKHKWASVFIKPSLWWRLKSVFVCPEIWFCWGQDSWTIRGFKNEKFLSIGNVPDFVEQQLRGQSMPVRKEPSHDQ